MDKYYLQNERLISSILQSWDCQLKLRKERVLRQICVAHQDKSVWHTTFYESMVRVKSIN